MLENTESTSTTATPSTSDDPTSESTPPASKHRRKSLTSRVRRGLRLLADTWEAGEISLSYSQQTDLDKAIEWIRSLEE